VLVELLKFTGHYVEYSWTLESEFQYQIILLDKVQRREVVQLNAKDKKLRACEDASSRYCTFYNALCCSPDKRCPVVVLSTWYTPYVRLMVPDL
jgi:hypothetical protein